MAEGAAQIDEAIARSLSEQGPQALSSLTHEVRTAVPEVTRSQVLRRLEAGSGATYFDHGGVWSLASTPEGTSREATAGDAGDAERTKQDVVDDLCALLDLPPMHLRRGSTERKPLLEGAARALGVGHPPWASKLDIARAIVDAAGLPWLPTYDSTSTRSGGGGTITTPGLEGVLEAARSLLEQGEPLPMDEALPMPQVDPTPKRPRSPNWTNDELILALDLYREVGAAGQESSQVIELSDLLCSLPIHPEAAKGERFRNPTGVSLKLANFRTLDGEHGGKGMSHGSRGDKVIWDRFSGDREELRRTAAEIRALAQAGHVDALAPVEDEDEILEGALLFRVHRWRERDQSVAQRKRDQVMEREGALACEGCGFVFSEAYGERGEGFIEVHHLVPLSAAGPRTTRLEDLAVLCSNCHRMIHRRQPWLDLDALRALLREG